MGEETGRRSRIGKTALILGLVAFGFYAGFIIMGILRS